MARVSDGSSLARMRSECGLELEAMGRLNTAVRRQLIAVELGHPDAVQIVAAEGWKPRPW